MFTVAHLHIDRSKPGRTQIIHIAGRSCRIESHGIEYIPGRHLSAIVISTECIRLIPIKGIHDITHLLLAFPGLFQVIIEIQDLMARLITMPVSPYPSLNIVCPGDIIGHLGNEHRIEAFPEQIFSGFIDIPLHIMRNIPGVL